MYVGSSIRIQRKTWQISSYTLTQAELHRHFKEACLDLLGQLNEEDQVKY